jgi:rfaE bifunctional protein kinase chain/domain
MSKLPVSKTKSQLLQILERLPEQKVAVIGDVILDRYVWGQVERISPEAPVPVVEVQKTEDRLGGAGNVVRNLRGLGVQVSCCALVGNDVEGEIVRKQLAELGVSTNSVVTDSERPTSLKTRVIAHAQQVVRFDREQRHQAPRATADALAKAVEAEFSQSGAVILSDYGKGAISEAIMRKLHDAQTAGRLGLRGRPFLVDPHPSSYHLYGKISIIKPNRKEAEKASGIDIESREDAYAAAKRLLERWQAEMVMITLGEDGLVLVQGGLDPIYLETRAREVFDVSGAGDTVAAVFTAALATGAEARLAGELANIAAGVVVAEVGTVSITTAALKNAIDDAGL